MSKSGGPAGAPLRPRGAIRQSRDDTQLLQDQHIQISMSREGTPWDNATCESFMKTLKYEQV
jgi:transposase InsO family protein